MDDLFGGFEGEGLTEADNATLSKVKPVEKKNLTNEAKNTNLKTKKRQREATPSKEPVETTVTKDESDTETKTKKMKPRPPAKVYPFELDTFQKEAVSYLENNESVLVSAHTSAGKTAVAEYAIAMALRDNQRVVYTSPIKALSNQKYRDLHAEFSDVGLMTGDVTINPNASCLVMTTEILRSMLYRGSEILREVAWAIFDEVHYMRDRDRGVVWEESIILLPHKVRYVFLSATIPNGAQFCRWVSKIHKQPCHIVYTEYRPTPLQHFIFPAGGEGLFLIVDGKTKKFHDGNFDRAMAALGGSGSALQDAVNEGSGNSKEARKMQRMKKTTKVTDLQRIVDLVIQRAYDPVIVFSFSKKDCEMYALKLSKMDFNEEPKKVLIKEIYENAIDSLNDDDKGLPQVKSLLPLLQRGIGIHHGGLLPILKEVTEILFGEGLLKVLIATETFAMGINMPAKTVVFTATKKFDGTDFRHVRAGEYIQMSGRAGRRGKDDRGIVIQMADEKLEPAEAKEMMTGQADPLSSTFHLGYNMLLNLFRVEEPEYMIRNSLYMFQQEEAVPELKTKLKELEDENKAIEIGEKEEDIAELYHLNRQLEKARRQIRSVVNIPNHCVPFLQPGRLVQVTDDARGEAWGWGVIIKHRKLKGSAPKDAGEEQQLFEHIVDVLLPASKATAFSSSPKPASRDESGNPVEGSKYIIVPCALNTLDGLSAVRLNLPKDLRSDESKAGVWRSVKEVKRRFEKIPILNPCDDMKITDTALINTVNSATSFEEEIKGCSAQKIEEKERKELYENFVKKMALKAQQKAIEKEIRTTESLPMKDQLKRMKLVMRRLGHIDKENVVQLKGRVACEISTCDELLATELVLGGVFNDMSPEITAALVSCLVFTEKGDSEVKVRSELQAPLNILQAAARKIGEIQKDARVPLDVDEYVKSFRPDLMEPVYQWCKGAKFSEVCQLTEIFEGTIIRCVRRLEELVRQLCAAAKVVGDTALEKKFMEAIKMIKRDIIFAASLYL